MTTYVLPASSVTTDGTTLQGNGTAGSPIAVKNAGITATQIATGAVDGTTLTGGGGTALGIKASGVTATQIASGAVTATGLATSAFDGKTLTGGGGTAASLNSTTGTEVELTTLTATTIATYTPASAGPFLLTVYFRVVTAATNVTLTATWTDVTGAQTYTWLSASSQAIGSYNLLPLKIASTATVITISATAGTASQVYVTGTILPIAA